MEATHKPALIGALPSIQVSQAMAQTTKVNRAPVKDVSDDGLQKERDLFALLQKRQNELEARETAVKAEEQKIADLKKEILQKIDALKQLQTQLSPVMEMERTNEMKRIKDLAKVYEAAPPEKAAAAIEKLGVKTAALLTINMKRDRAGLILGHLTPLKAVAITNEITRSNQTVAE